MRTAEESLARLVDLAEKQHAQGDEAGVSQEFDRTSSETLLLASRRRVRSPSIAGPGGVLVAARPVELIRALYRQPRPAMLKFQNAGQTGGVGHVQIEVVEAVASATFTRKFNLFPGPPRTLRVFGRLIDVNAYALVTNDKDCDVQISSLITTHNIDVLGELFPSWIPGNTDIASGAQDVSGAPGFLLGGEGELVKLGGADAGPYYLLFFDTTAADLVGGQAPIYTSSPLLAGSDFSFSHYQERDIIMTTALSMAFSSTPNSYTAVSAGASGFCGVTVGA